MNADEARAAADRTLALDLAAGVAVSDVPVVALGRALAVSFRYGAPQPITVTHDAAHATLVDAAIERADLYGDRLAPDRVAVYSRLGDKLRAVAERVDFNAFHYPLGEQWG